MLDLLDDKVAGAFSGNVNLHEYEAQIDSLAAIYEQLRLSLGRQNKSSDLPFPGSAGWRVGKDRVQRIWRREGLMVPAEQRPKGRLWLDDGSCVRLRPEHANRVRSYNFVSAVTHCGRTLGMRPRF